MLRDLPPGTAAAASKWQFSHFKSTWPQSDTRVHFRLFPHLLYIIKAHVISTEGDQPSWFSQEWGCSQDMRLSFKTRKVPGEPGWVSHPVTYTASGSLSFLHSLGDINDLYVFPDPSVSFSPSLAFRPLFMGLPGLSRCFRHHSWTPSVGCFVIAPKLVWELSTPLSAQMWQEKAIS